MSLVKKFRVNNYLSLGLKEGTTSIFVNGRLFRQCRFLMLHIPIDDVVKFDDVRSIDEAAGTLDWSLEGNRGGMEISPEDEFWGHCSNLQAWAENNYNTNLLHSSLAFYLLKELVAVGDPLAHKVFKEEIVKQFNTGTVQVSYYLIDEGFLDIFDENELDFLRLGNNARLRKRLEDSYERISFYLLLELVEGYNDFEALNLLKEKLTKLYERENIDFIRELKILGFYDIFNNEELKDLIFRSESSITANFLLILKKANISLSYVFQCLKNFERVSYNATKDLLFDFFEYGYVDASTSVIKNAREDFSDRTLSESFETILSLLKHRKKRAK